MGGVGAGCLRDQAVEAVDRVLEDDEVRADVVADRAVAAAEPFLRAQVIAEVVEWLRDRTGQSPYSLSQRVSVAAQIERWTEADEGQASDQAIAIVAEVESRLGGYFSPSDRSAVAEVIAEIVAEHRAEFGGKHAD